MRRSKLASALLAACLWAYAGSSACSGNAAPSPPAGAAPTDQMAPAAKPDPLDLAALEAAYYAVNGPRPDPDPPPTSLLILDPWGGPVAGAQVRLIGPREPPPPPAAVSDAAGRAPLPTAPLSGSWAAEVIAAGYARAAEHPDGGRIVLRRGVSALVAALAANPGTDAAGRARIALEWAGPPPMDWDTDEAFLSLSLILPELRAIVDSGRFIAPDMGRGSPAARARALLTWWGAEEDRGRIDPPDDARQRTPDLVAADVWSICRQFTELHFTQEGFSNPAERTMNYCADPRLSLDGSRALIELYVRYQAWSYTIRLTARREPGAAGGWRLYDARMGLTEHYD